MFHSPWLLLLFAATIEGGLLISVLYTGCACTIFMLLGSCLFILPTMKTFDRFLFGEFSVFFLFPARFPSRWRYPPPILAISWRDMKCYPEVFWAAQRTSIPTPAWLNLTSSNILFSSWLRVSQLVLFCEDMILRINGFGFSSCAAVWV